MAYISTLASANAGQNLLLAIASFADSAVWAAMVQIFVLAAALLLANVLRRTIPFLRKSLIPTALLGGMMVLLLKFIPAVSNFIDNDLMETLTYHCLALGFIASALKKNTGSKKTSTKAIVETGVLTGSVYAMQATFGIGISIILFVAGAFAFPAGGILLALGYGQGTGQALNFGAGFENDYGFAGGKTFGLSIAAIGFLVASIVGVVYLNVMRRRGKLRVLTAEDRQVVHKLEDFVGENEMPNTDSVDKFTITIGLVVLIYGVVYGIMSLVKINLIWGFNFLLGSLLALATRLLLNLLSKKKVFKREPTNNYLLDRISGTMFDTMIIAGVAAINWDDFFQNNMWWQLLIICAVGAVVTFVYIHIVAKNIYKGYEQEGFISMFGMMTGTASSGMILLREIDPRLETPASSNLVFSGLPAIAFGGGLLLVLNYCPKGLTESIVTLAIVFAAWVVFTVVLFRNKIFRRKKVAVAESAEIVENAADTGAETAENDQISSENTPQQ